MLEKIVFSLKSFKKMEQVVLQAQAGIEHIVNPTKFENQDFYDYDFSNKVIYAGCYINCSFRRCSFANSDVISSKFDFCSFIDCDFSQSNWIKTEFYSCVIQNSNLNKMHLQACSIDKQFAKCLGDAASNSFNKREYVNEPPMETISDQEFTKSTSLAYFDFSNKILKNVIFTGIDFSQAGFVSFAGSDLHDCKFINCLISGDFSNSNHFGTVIKNCKFDKKNINRTSMFSKDLSFQESDAYAFLPTNKPNYRIPRTRIL